MTVHPTGVARALPAPVTRGTLSNGLRVCIVPDPQMPLVGINLMYAVGSANEPPDMKGFAHLFEHLMFAGSQNVAAGELSATLGAVGAQPNAYTDFDVTSYHATVPTGALERALWLEADRMGGMLAALDQRTLDNERDIVRNERRQTMETVPFGLLWERLNQALFPPEHPYHWIPMGSMQHLMDADLETVRAFFSRHYGPNNAVLTLVGDVEPDHGLELAQTYFGGIPRNDAIPAAPDTTIGPLEQEVRILMDEPMPVAAVLAAHRIPGRSHPDWAPLHVAGQILGDGGASRLGTRLILTDGLAQQVRANTVNLIGATDIFTIGMWLSEQAELSHCEAVRDEIIADLGQGGPDEAELERARASMERGLFSQISTRDGLAEWVCREELHHPGADPVQTYLGAVNAVTVDDVARAVATWLTPQRRAQVTYPADQTVTEEHFDD